MDCPPGHGWLGRGAGMSWLLPSGMGAHQLCVHFLKLVEAVPVVCGSSFFGLMASSFGLWRPHRKRRASRGGGSYAQIPGPPLAGPDRA